jgi:hypothetical protein
LSIATDIATLEPAIIIQWPTSRQCDFLLNRHGPAIDYQPTASSR